MNKIKNFIQGLWIKILHGRLTGEVVDVIQGFQCEIKYLDRKGMVVGYWAYGSFDPYLPYRGQFYVPVSPVLYPSYIKEAL